MVKAKPAAAAPVVVIDTKLVLSALVFGNGNGNGNGNGRVSALRTAWQSGQCPPLASTATAAELTRVMAYPKFKLTAADREELLADYRPYCRSVRMPARLPKLPQCRSAAVPQCRSAAVPRRQRSNVH